MRTCAQAMDGKRRQETTAKRRGDAGQRVEAKMRVSMGLDDIGDGAASLFSLPLGRSEPAWELVDASCVLRTGHKLLPERPLLFARATLPLP
jgi:hypothetical protein